MTYYGIFSLFPLMLLFMAIGGIILQNNDYVREQVVNLIVGLLPQDPEIRRYVAQKLCSLASQLFRIKRGADGNRLLARAQRLHTLRPGGAPNGPANHLANGLANSLPPGESRAASAPLIFPARLAQ